MKKLPCSFIRHTFSRTVLIPDNNFDTRICQVPVRSEVIGPEDERSRNRKLE